MKVALIGLMASGKSTLMSAISGKEPAMMGAVSVHEAVVNVPDERFDWLIENYKPKKTVYGTVDCLDMPGFNFADENGRQQARKLLNQIRTADMFVIVARAFDDPTVPAYNGQVDLVRDIRLLKDELLLTDLEMVTTRIEKLEKSVHKPSKTQKQEKDELAVQLKLLEVLEQEKPILAADLSEGEMAIVRSLNFLTLKPTMVVVNVGEDELDKQFDLSGVVDSSVQVLSLSAKIEQELSQMDEETRNEFMADFGISEPASLKFMTSCYESLGLISFLTVGPDEVRAWPIKRGTTALDAAGKIHSDIKRGFIRAETMAYDDLRTLGDEKEVKAAGKMRLEGKEYIVKDGDIISFRFNV